MSRRLFGYLRVSKADRKGDTSLSIDAQRAAIEDYATTRGDVIVAWYVDEGISGKSTDRPGLQSMLTALAARPKQRDADGVVATKLDRLSRSRERAATARRQRTRQTPQLVARLLFGLARGLGLLELAGVVAHASTGTNAASSELRDLHGADLAGLDPRPRHDAAPAPT